MRHRAPVVAVGVQRGQGVRCGAVGGGCAVQGCVGCGGGAQPRARVRSTVLMSARVGDPLARFILWFSRYQPNAQGVDRAGRDLREKDREHDIGETVVVDLTLHIHRNGCVG